MVLAKERYGLRGRDLLDRNAEFIPFSATTRMSGADLDGRRIRKGATDAVVAWVTEQGGTVPDQLTPMVEEIARSGGTPLVVADGARPLGVIHLKDMVKGGIRERFDQLRRMGIKTIMITGDNRLTAATIADEAGVDDFLAEATPEAKLELIKQQQADGRMVAMTGDGTNDAPALAQADVGVTMNTGTQAAREAGNMIDLDSNPTKLIEIVEVGKQLLITRGALTTFSIANDVAKYFAILPAMFATTYAAAGDPTGPLNQLNVMGLGTPLSAIMSAVIFNALIIPLLVPLALRGVRYRPVGANALLRRNVWLYGFGGIIAPFIGIKLVDLDRPQPPGRLTHDHPRDASCVPRDGPWGRQDLLHAGRGTAPQGPRQRRRGRLCRDLRSAEDRGDAPRPRDGAATHPHLPRRDLHRDGPGSRPRPPPADRPGRRARPHQHPRLQARQALAGRRGAARCRHHRDQHRQRPAPGVTQRRGRAHHRRQAARDRPRRGGPPRRPDRAGRHHAGGPAPPDGPRQHLPGREDRRRPHQLLQDRQPDRPP